MLYFFTATMHSVLDSIPILKVYSGCFELSSRIENVEQYSTFYDELKEFLFNSYLAKKYPYLSLSDFVLTIITLNPL